PQRIQSDRKPGRMGIPGQNRRYQRAGSYYQRYQRPLYSAGCKDHVRRYPQFPLGTVRWLPSYVLRRRKRQILQPSERVDGRTRLIEENRKIQKRLEKTGKTSIINKDTAFA